MSNTGRGDGVSVCWCGSTHSWERAKGVPRYGDCLQCHRPVLVRQTHTEHVHGLVHDDCLGLSDPTKETT